MRQRGKALSRQQAMQRFAREVSAACAEHMTEEGFECVGRALEGIYDAGLEQGRESERERASRPGQCSALTGRDVQCRLRARPGSEFCRVHA